MILVTNFMQSTWTILDVYAQEQTVWSVDRESYTSFTIIVFDLLSLIVLHTFVISTILQVCHPILFPNSWKLPCTFCSYFLYIIIFPVWHLTFFGIQMLNLQIWRWTQEEGWKQDGNSLLGHKDWVRDVAWCPNLGMPSNTIASASQDSTVIIWCENLQKQEWEAVRLPDFKVKWSFKFDIQLKCYAINICYATRDIPNYWASLTRLSVMNLMYLLASTARHH